MIFCSINLSLIHQGFKFLLNILLILNKVFLFLFFLIFTLRKYFLKFKFRIYKNLLWFHYCLKIIIINEKENDSCLNKKDIFIDEQKIIIDK